MHLVVFGTVYCWKGRCKKYVNQDKNKVEFKAGLRGVD